MRRHTYTYVCPYPDNNCKNNFCQIFCNEGSCAYVHRYEYAHYAQVLVYARAYPSPGLQKHFCQIFSDKKVRTSAKARQGWVCTYAGIMRTYEYAYVRVHESRGSRNQQFLSDILLMLPLLLQLAKGYVCTYVHRHGWVCTGTCLGTCGHAGEYSTHSNQQFLSDIFVGSRRRLRVCVCTYVRTGPRTRIMRAREPTKNVRYFCHIFCKIFSKKMSYFYSDSSVCYTVVIVHRVRLSC